MLPLRERLLALTKNTGYLLLAYIIVTVFASIYPFFLPDKNGYKMYNNYVIFKQSFFHLINHKDLYILYLDEQWDLFKYSPAFALFMGLFAWMPDMLGATLWNLLNSLTLFFAVMALPQLSKSPKHQIVLYIFLETLTAIQNFQSNALIAGLIVLAFSFLERRNVWIAALCITLTVFIKIFGVVAFCLFLFYPNKIKFLIASLLWSIVFLMLPLLALPWQELLLQYQSWGRMLSEDHSISYGLSVMGWLHTWFRIDGIKNIVVLLGIILFCLPLLKISSYKNELFRLFLVASILLWMVIFNHKAESPTFVIAITGVAIWYFSQEKNRLNTVLVWFAFFFTSLSPTDLVPRIAREFINEYTLKAVPCIFIWFKLLYDTMKLSSKKMVTDPL